MRRLFGSRTIALFCLALPCMAATSLVAPGLVTPALATSTPATTAGTEALPAYALERSAVHALRAAETGRRYDLNVRLPPGYDEPANRDRRYPVLYLTDGDYTFQVAAGITRLLFSQEKMEEFILVGISNDREAPGATGRNRDLTPWENPRYTGTGEAARYLHFMETEAIPLIERSYRADPARRMLAGQSYGGLFGLWVLLTRPELFESYLLTSPSIWYAEKALSDLADGLKAKPGIKARVYMATGGYETLNPASDDPRWHKTNDMVTDSKEMAARLTALKLKGLRIRNDVTEGTVHETTFPVGLVHGLHWLFPYLGK